MCTFSYTANIQPEVQFPHFGWQFQSKYSYNLYERMCKNVFLKSFPYCRLRQIKFKIYFPNGLLSKLLWYGQHSVQTLLFVVCFSIYKPHPPISLRVSVQKTVALKSECRKISTEVQRFKLQGANPTVQFNCAALNFALVFSKAFHSWD